MLKKTLILLALLAMAVPAFAVPSTPWRAYDLDEGTGTTVNPLDAGVSGTVAGGALTWVAGASGDADDYALQQAGGGYIPFVETYAMNSNYSISIWLKHSSSFTGTESAFGADGGTGGPMFKKDSGATPTWNHGSTTWTAYAADATIGDGDWHNYVLTYHPTGTVQHVYIDGVDTDTWLDEWTGGMGSTASRMTLFYSFWGTAGSWTGAIDEFAVWQATLSADDAAWLAENRLGGLYGEPIAEPAALTLLGLGALALRRRRS